MSKSILDIDWKLNEINTAAKNVNEITNEWKERFLKKLKKVTATVENIGVPPPVTEIENHPLLNDVILGEILSYIDTPTFEDSTSTLISMRQVCLKWKERVTPRLLTRLQVRISTLGDLDSNSIPPSALKNTEHLRSLMNQAPKISLIQINREFGEDDSNESEQNEFWKIPYNWIQTFGHKLTHLTLKDSQVREDVMWYLLHNWTSNLEALTLENVNLIPIKRESPENATTDPYKDLKHLELHYSHHDHNNKTVKSVAEAGLKVLMQTNNLESLTVNLSLYKPLINSIISMDKEILKNLTKLIIKDNFKRDGIHLMPIFSKPKLRLLNELELTNLKELEIDTIGVIGDKSITMLLRTIGQQLEKLSVHVASFSCYLDEDEDIFVPEMPNLKEFTYSYGRKYGNITNIGPDLCTVPKAYNALSVIQAMPALEAFHFKKCDDVLPRIERSSYALCLQGKCNHVEKLLETENGQFALPVHSDLEQLGISCCFRNPNLARLVSNAFINLRELSIWINSGFLKQIFKHLSTLSKLELLTIQLNKTIEDFPMAVNAHLGKFINLKELTFMKSTSPIFHKTDCLILCVHLADTGFAKCQSLEIVSFRNLNINPSKLKRLRNAILKSRPRLVINHHCQELESSHQHS